MTDHLGEPMPSPALLDKIGNQLRSDVKDYAAQHGIPDPGAEEA